MALVMDDTEIAIHYRLALDKLKDIKVMAELCGTNEREIWAALERTGTAALKEKYSNHQGGRRKRLAGSLETLARKLYEFGLDDERIAKKVGMSSSAVWRWRARNKLPSQKARQKESAARR